MMLPTYFSKLLIFQIESLKLKIIDYIVLFKSINLVPKIRRQKLPMSWTNSEHSRTKLYSDLQFQIH